MQSPREFAQSIQDASSFVILNDNKVQFVNIDIIANMIKERDEAIRNERMRLKERVPNPLEFLDDFGKGE